MLVFSAASMAAYADFPDTGGHWAQAPIDRWAGYSVLGGYTDGTFAPDGLITRGELFKVLDVVFSYQKDGANIFSDLSETDWYYGHVLKLTGAGVLNGSGGLVSANDSITREQAFAMLARVFEIAPNERGLDGFSDADAVSGWARAEVGGLAAKGYVQGSGGALNPGGNLTRAEAVQVLDNIIKGYYSVAGTYSVDIEGGAALVNVSGVDLDDSFIGGDLYATQGLKDGEFTLSGSTLEGTMFVRGGGPNSIRILNSSVGAVSVKTDEATGAVRVATEGSSLVGPVSIADGSAGTILAGSFEEVTVGADTVLRVGEGSEIGHIAVVGAAAIVNVDNGAKVESIDIGAGADSAQIAVDGAVGQISVSAGEAVITAGADGEIAEVAVKSGSAEIAGDGAVGEVTVSARAEAKVETEGTKIERETSSSSSTATDSSSTTTTTPGGGGGGGGGGDNSSSDTGLLDVAEVANAKVVAEELSYSASQFDALTAASAKAAAGAIFAARNLGGVSYVVNEKAFVAAVAGDSANPAGTDGSYKFTLTLSKGSATAVETVELTMEIVAATADELSQSASLAASASLSSSEVASASEALSESVSLSLSVSALTPSASESESESVSESEALSSSLSTAFSASESLSTTFSESEALSSSLADSHSLSSSAVESASKSVSDETSESESVSSAQSATASTSTSLVQSATASATISASVVDSKNSSEVASTSASSASISTSASIAAGKLGTPVVKAVGTSTNQIEIEMTTTTNIAVFEVTLTTNNSSVTGLPPTFTVPCDGTTTTINVVELAKLAGASITTTITLDIEVKAIHTGTERALDSDVAILTNKELDFS
jgi:hypothetical protein